MSFDQFPINLETAKGSYSVDAIRHGDQARMIELMNIPSIAQNLYSPPTPFTQADADKAILDSNKSLTTLRGDVLPTRFAVRDADGLLQGGLGFRYIDDKSLTMGYYLAPEARGRKVLHAALDKLFPFFAGLVVFGSANVGNRGSEQVMLESGFEPIPGIDEWLEFPESKGGGRRPFKKYKRQC